MTKPVPLTATAEALAAKTAPHVAAREAARLQLTPTGEGLAQRIRKADVEYQRALASAAIKAELLYSTVQDARNYGMTWPAIAHIFGTTPQAAQSRFSKPAPRVLI